jgi:DNA replication and repair protein RecF
VLSLVLAEAELLRARTDVSPLVLLDDVLSELDGSRRLALADAIARSAQTVVTATAEAALPVPAAQSLSVSPGRIE